ncbi:family 20 glycosylhydrolase [Cellulomonas sp. P22]|uniref:family 20 glycosylhydrolase n=1 Tax=Cellulomonas sp. P22 TaxID=3373189 RepID=UPI0037BD3881
MPQPLSLVPQPLRCTQLDDAPFVLGPGLAVLVGESPDEVAVGVRVADVLGRITRHAVELRPGASDETAACVVVLRLDPRAAVPAHASTPLADADATTAESYRLTVRPGRVEVVAPTPAGLLGGFVTFRQLLRYSDDGALVAPAVHVEDVPRYRWRGLSVDVARSFFGLEDLKVVVSLMTHHKLNVLHLHLTDDQGWRVDLPSRPRLARTSGSTAVQGGRPGYLCAEALTELTAYARARNVTVVPEIDVPGHVNAALHAYPELTPTGEDPGGYTGVEVGFSRLHADLPATHAFLRDVFTDLAALTPGEYVHLGGDEVLTMDAPEYARLVGAAAEVLRTAGKTVVGWQEVATVPLPSGSVVQLWDLREDLQHVVAATRAGARLLVSPGSRTYLDMKYDATTVAGLEWAGHIELRDAYDWEPATLAEGVDPQAVIGVEAAVWTETLHDLDGLMRMLLPRLAAVAEVAWTVPERRSWEDFRTRVAGQGPMWDAAGLAWHPSPQVDWPARPSRFGFAPSPAPAADPAVAGS